MEPDNKMRAKMALKTSNFRWRKINITDNSKEDIKKKKKKNDNEEEGNQKHKVHV